MRRSKSVAGCVRLPTSTSGSKACFAHEPGSHLLVGTAAVSKKSSAPRDQASAICSGRSCAVIRGRLDWIVIRGPRGIASTHTLGHHTRWPSSIKNHQIRTVHTRSPPTGTSIRRPRSRDTPNVSTVRPCLILVIHRRRRQAKSRGTGWERSGIGAVVVLAAVAGSPCRGLSPS